MKRSGYFLAILISTILLALFTTLYAAGLIPPNPVTQVNAGSDALESEPKIERSKGAVQNTPFPPDGLALVEDRCTQCHLLQWIEQVAMSPAGWEKTLDWMEAMGVQLEDAEKAILLNYLTDEEE